jgi:hypothetical protein
MKKLRIFKVKLGYNPNSSAHSSLFAVFFSTVFSLIITLFTSFIFADILFRKVSKERKIFPRIVFVALIPLVFVVIFFVFEHEIIPPLLPGLLTLSIILFVFTPLRIPALVSGFFLIIGNFLIFSLALVFPWLYLSHLSYLASLLGLYGAGFLVGYLILKRRRKDEGSV